MRWRYLFDKDDPDFQKKEEKLKRIKNFWIAFEKICLPHWEMRDIDKEALNNFAQWMQKQLALIDENLMWEAHIAEDNTTNLVVTAESIYSNSELAKSVIDAAPKWEGWNFLSHRLATKPENLSTYCENVANFEPPDDLRASFTKTEWNKIELTYYSNKFGMMNVAESVEKCLLLSQYALGEEMFERWIDIVLPVKHVSVPGKIFGQIFGKKTQSKENFSLDVLQIECEKLKKSILDTLPDTYVSEILPSEKNEDCTYWSAGLEPQEGDESVRKERLFYSMKSEPILKAVLNGMYFHSECHSKKNEVFCFIKSIPFDYDSDYAQEKREEFEVDLDCELRDQNLGCVLGTGAGQASMFVDLVLTDVELAVPVLQKVVRKYALPEGTWLLFYDSHHCEEWVGLNPLAKSPF